MSAQHTPGPWDTHWCADHTGYPCFYIHGFAGAAKRDADVMGANARLIAAAPDMLDALRDMLALDERIDCLAGNEDVREGIRYAIAKAEGAE